MLVFPKLLLSSGHFSTLNTRDFLEKNNLDQTVGIHKNNLGLQFVIHPNHLQNPHPPQHAMELHAIQT
jgi:hypothetical protein